MTDALRPFDGPEPWATVRESPQYEIEVNTGEGNWMPSIHITTGEDAPDYYFIQSADDKGTFTPGYAVYIPPKDGDIFQLVLSMPDEEPVQTWMKAAIERAGFNYDHTPNNVRWRERDTIRTPSDQTELV